MADRFLVSTTHHLLTLDIDSHQMWRVHSGSGLYFGLARDPDGMIYVACRNTVQGPVDVAVRAAEIGSILRLDRSFQVVEEIRPPFPMRDVHGILCFDNRVWVTCSFDNMVAIYDRRTGEWSRWFPAPKPADRGRDVHHFNTVCELDGRIALIAHRFGPSELLLYDPVTLQLESAISLGVEAHNIFRFSGALATCSSRDGCLVNTAGDRLRTGNFPRGIALTPEGNLLGISMISHRSQRAFEPGVLRWYTPDWHYRRDYLLRGVGMVLDILTLPTSEYGWDRLETWVGAEISFGVYNRQAPGNDYTPSCFAACAGSNASEWHEPEETHCWTAAKRATLSIVVNPGETHLRIQIRSSFPGPYFAEIYLNGLLAGAARFSAPGFQQLELPIPAGTQGPVTLSFGVPFLWRPAELLPSQPDERLLGVAVHGVIVDIGPGPVTPQGFPNAQ